MYFAPKYDVVYSYVIRNNFVFAQTNLLTSKPRAKREQDFMISKS